MSTSAATINTAVAGQPGTPDIAALFERQQTRALALRTSTARERVERIKQLKQLILERRADMARACAADFKKPAAEVEATEILPIIQEANAAIRHAKKWMQPKPVAPTRLLFGTQSAIHYEPRGVCLIVSPWNYPFNLTFGPLVSALAAGNTAILKPSEMTPHCAALMQEMIADLFPEDEVAVIQGAAETTQQLLGQPFDHIFFTGSPTIGKIVMRAAAEHLTSVTLELGGKSPAIVDASADVDQAAKNIAWGKFANNGQTCIAPDYVYVHEDVRSAFAEAVDKALHKLYGAQERIANNADYCRMVNNRHYERVSAIIDDAKNRDATILRGGERDATERFIAPTVIGDVPADARLMQEEIFGPVLPILTYRDTDEVIAGINGRPKALALYLFARDKTVSERIIAETSAGGTSINTTLMHYMHGRLPFGGVNNSGIGSAHGHWGFKAFSHERAVLRNRFAPVFLFMPPYGRLTRLVARLATRFMS